MADLPPYNDSSGETGDESDRESITGTPRWVKVFGIITLLVVLAFVIMLVTQGPHRPGMHGGEAPASSVVALGGVGGHDPSEWDH
ncbi:MAG: hypothetical protein M3118_07600 [Actinomycetota bacterium]|nr:hypothetical protein [Actinomycetota bacterium]